jgi:hypothetical protein
MIGKNDLSMNQAEMCNAIQTYLNEHVLKTPVTVTAVNPEKTSGYGSSGFKIEMEPAVAATEAEQEKQT